MTQQDFDAIKNDLFSLLYFGYIEKCEDMNISPLVKQENFKQSWIKWLQNGYMSFQEYQFQYMNYSLEKVIIPYLKTKIT